VLACVLEIARVGMRTWKLRDAAMRTGIERTIWDDRALVSLVAKLFLLSVPTDLQRDFNLNQN
jgi:hypothetical protein